MPSVKWATGTRHKARGTTKAAPAKNRVLGPASREPEVVAKEQLWGVCGRGGGGVCNTYITDFAPRACPRFWRCISAWEVGSVFWPKTIVRNAIFARRIRNSFRSSSKCYAGGGGEGDCCGSCLGCCHKRKLLLSARRLLATQHLVPLSQYHLSVPLFDILFSLVLSVCLTASKLYLVMQKGQRRQRLPRLQLQLLYR